MRCRCVQLCVPLLALVMGLPGCEEGSDAEGDSLAENGESGGDETETGGDGEDGEDGGGGGDPGASEFADCDWWPDASSCLDLECGADADEKDLIQRFLDTAESNGIRDLIRVTGFETVEGSPNPIRVHFVFENDWFVGDMMVFGVPDPGEWESDCRIVLDYLPTAVADRDDVVAAVESCHPNLEIDICTSFQHAPGNPYSLVIVEDFVDEEQCIAYTAHVNPATASVIGCFEYDCNDEGGP